MIAARGVALAAGRRIFKSLTVRENLIVQGACRRMANRQTRPWTTILSRCFALKERHNQIRRDLSRRGASDAGDRPCADGNPRVLLMMNPPRAAPQIVVEVMEHIRKLKESGLSIVLVEQKSQTGVRCRRRYVILNTGR